MSKRGESIWKRKDGRWEGRYIKGRTTDGKAIYASVYAKTYAEVKEKKNAAIICNTSNQTNNIFGNKELSFRNMVDAFLNYQRNIIKASSLARYFEISKNYIIPQIGYIKIMNMKQEILDEFITGLQTYKKKNGDLLSSKTIQDIISVFKLIIKYAENKKYILPLNLNYNLPKQQKKMIKVLNGCQCKTLEQYVCDKCDTYKFGVYLSLYTGVRIGELCALKWEDIDCRNSFMRINKTVLRITNIVDTSVSKTSVVINSPKSSASERIIPLPEILLKMIQNFMPEKNENIYLLTGSEKFIEPRIYYERYKRYLKECGLEGYTFHTLRHTFATNCIEKGIDPKVLSEILGHSSVRLTLDRYVHPSLENKRSCIERLFAN